MRIRPEFVCPTCSRSLICAQFEAPSWLEFRMCNRARCFIVSLVAVEDVGHSLAAHTCIEFVDEPEARKFVAELPAEAIVGVGVAGPITPDVMQRDWPCRRCCDNRTEVNRAWLDKHGRDVFVDDLPPLPATLAPPALSEDDT